MSMRFDPYSVDPVDPYLAEHGRVSPVRHNPAGHEDCARDWEPCSCHGDRLCRLGKLMSWARTSAEHAAWLRGERETPAGAELLRMSGCGTDWELALKARASERNARDLWREAWPLLVACATEERNHA
jgi:hypothetical protein